jgi:hypothetical protein
MKTPSEKDIKSINTQTKLDYKTTYDFDGSLNYILPAVNTDEIIKRQRAGEKTSLFTTKSHGPGPVQIDVELQGAPYMLSSFESVLLFKIKNRGSGALVKSQIDSGKMEIIFPPELFVDEAKSSEKFSCSQLPDGSTSCINNKKKGTEDLGIIPLYRDESRSSLRFAVKLREPLLEPFRSYQITSAVRYSYELRNSVDLTTIGLRVTSRQIGSWIPQVAGSQLRSRVFTASQTSEGRTSLGPNSARNSSHLERKFVARLRQESSYQGVSWLVFRQSLRSRAGNQRSCRHLSGTSRLKARQQTQ